MNYTFGIPAQRCRARRYGARYNVYCAQLIGSNDLGSNVLGAPVTDLFDYITALVITILGNTINHGITNRDLIRTMWCTPIPGVNIQPAAVSRPVLRFILLYITNM